MWVDCEGPRPPAARRREHKGTCEGRGACGTPPEVQRREVHAGSTSHRIFHQPFCGFGTCKLRCGTWSLVPRQAQPALGFVRVAVCLPPVDSCVAHLWSALLRPPVGQSTACMAAVPPRRCPHGLMRELRRSRRRCAADGGAPVWG